MSVTARTSHDPIGPCGPLEQSKSDCFRHCAMARRSSSLDFGAHAVMAYYRGHMVKVSPRVRIMIRIRTMVWVRVTVRVRLRDRVAESFVVAETEKVPARVKVSERRKVRARR